MKKKKTKEDDIYKLLFTFRDRQLYIDIDTYRDYRGVTGKDLDTLSVEKILGLADGDATDEEIIENLKIAVHEMKKAKDIY